MVGVHSVLPWAYLASYPTPNVHILFADVWPIFLESFTKFGALLLSGWSAKLMGR